MARRATAAASSSGLHARDYVADCNRYALDVVTGKIPNCRWAKAAAQRHIDNLKASRGKDYPYYFDDRAASLICAFAESLPHVKGKWAKDRELIVLQPWQCFVFCVLFGWLRHDNSKRRFRKAYIKIPRKNGKSILAAIIGLYMLCMDDEFGAEVYSGATSEAQAWEVFRPAMAMFRSPEAAELRDFVGGEPWAKSISIADGGRFQPLIGKPGDGSSPSCAIADEYHEHDTPEQLDTMETGMGAREQPLMLVITTAGNNFGGPCYDLELDARKTLQGVFEHEELFAIMYGIDEPEYEGDAGDDWTDPKILAKANPNIGVSVFEDFLKSQQRQATLNPIHQNRFKTKHLNVWCGAKVAFMPMMLWQMGGDKDLTIEDFEGKECIGILDLASKDDIACFGQLFFRDVTVKGKTDRHYWFFANYYVPEDWMYSPDNINGPAYQKWHATGHLIATPGAEIDFRIIEADVMEYRDHVQMREVAFDPWRSTQLAQNIRDDGAETVEIGQKVGNMSAPMKEWLSAVKGGRFHHNDNPVTTWMVSNITAKTDIKDNIYPNKEKPHLKIDGGICIIMGMNRAMGNGEAAGIDDWLTHGPVGSGPAVKLAKR